jgi:leucyl-tRNA synthetase
MSSYEPQTHEPNWQKIWDAENCFAAGAANDSREKYYVLEMFPTPPAGYIWGMSGIIQWAM